MKPLRSFAFLLLLALLNLAGCAGAHFPVANDNSGQLYAVTAFSTPFYIHSPRQGGPDQLIPRDTLLRLVRYSPSFAKVALLEGPAGYVRTDDIAPSRHPVSTSARQTTLPPSSEAPALAEMPAPVPEPPLPEFEPTPLPAQTHTN